MQIQPAAITPSPAGQQHQTFGMSTSARGNSLTSSNDGFDDLNAAFIIDCRDGKDASQSEKNKLLDNNVALSDAYSKALMYRGELTSLLEEIVNVIGS
jgi:hypothetical protein